MCYKTREVFSTRLSAVIMGWSSCVGVHFVKKTSVFTDYTFSARVMGIFHFLSCGLPPVCGDSPPHEARVEK